MDKVSPPTQPIGAGGTDEFEETERTARLTQSGGRVRET